MQHDAMMTAPQAKRFGEWIEGTSDMADVMIRMDEGVLVIGQGDDRVAIKPNGKFEDEYLDEPYGYDKDGNKLVSFCPVCDAEGAGMSCTDENGDMIDDHNERGVRPVNRKGEFIGPVQ